MTKQTVAVLNFLNPPNDSRQDKMAKEGSATKPIVKRLQIMRLGWTYIH